MDAGLPQLIDRRGDAILFVARGDNDGDTAWFGLGHGLANGSVLG
jgi:hypothetical protein